ncbi:YrhK family protein [Oceanobacillus sp. FSL K6-2867]|uniref:YrhK family protein n=1 Tax=Oceanobacillus sp. FSL K6-2867 TaxID=2954748 RepID=UPI0030DAB996
MRLLKTKTYTRGYTKDISIYGQSLEVYFKKKYTFFQLVGDVLVGIFFVTGSILNFFSSTELFGSIAYLLGSLSLTIRPLLKILRNMWIYKN